MKIAIQLRRLLLALVVPVGLSLPAAQAAAADHPEVIRIGAPAISGNQQSIMGSPGVARVKGWLEDEFKAEGIRFEFPGFKGGAATVNQAIANDQIDFAYAGDLISIIGRAAGIKTRLILPCGKFENAYLAVRKGSSIRSVEDLRGRKVAYFKGSYAHLQAIKILAEHGMTEKDLKAINLDYGTAAAALASGDVEAIFGGLETLALRDRGIAELVYTTQGKAPQLSGQAGILVREDFAKRYPDVTARMVKVWVKAADWASDPANRDEVLKLWSRGSRTYEQMLGNYGERPLADRVSPLLDPYLIAQFERTQTLATELGLIRGPGFSIKEWFDSSYLDRALEQLRLTHRWKPLGPDGR